MIRDWLLGKIRAQAVDSGVKEMQGFVAGLKAMDDRDIGTIIAVATVIRINLETNDVIAADTFGDATLPSTETLGLYQMEINKLARQFARMGLATDSTAAMIWSYTLRCLNVPELRPLGRAMWDELERGFSHVEKALRKGEAEKGEPFSERVWAEWGIIPAEFRSSRIP
jgi:hypothetical protein